MLGIIGQQSKLIVRQKKEITEAIIGFETANKYAILDEHNRELAYAVEEGSGISLLLKRQFFRSHRTIKGRIIDRDGHHLLSFRRPFYFFFSTLHVTAPDGTALGSVHRRFGIIRKIFDLRTPEGKLFARIRGMLWRLWTFPLLDHENNEIGKIAKKWAGMVQEYFTDADTFLVDFGSAGWSDAERAVILCAALSIDFDFFESNQGSR